MTPFINFAERRTWHKGSTIRRDLDARKHSREKGMRSMLSELSFVYNIFLKKASEAFTVLSKVPYMRLTLKVLHPPRKGSNRGLSARLIIS